MDQIIGDQKDTFGRSLSAWADRHRKWIFISPALGFIALLVVGPLAWTILLGFTDASGSVRSQFSFIGLDNYVSIFLDTSRFWPSISRTFAFAATSVSFELVLGMSVALLLRKTFRGQASVRLVILLPLVTTPVVVGLMWMLILDPNIGFLNQVMSWIGLPGQSWLSDPHTALATLAFINIWEWTPMAALILLAGLTSLPDEPNEAAEMDGASAIQRFRYVTLPLMRPTIVTVVVLSGLEAMKAFDIILVAKGPGGGSAHEAETLNIYAYALNFTYNDYGMASAVVIIFVLILLSLFSLTLIKRRSASK